MNYEEKQILTKQTDFLYTIRRNTSLSNLEKLKTQANDLVET